MRNSSQCFYRNSKKKSHHKPNKLWVGQEREFYDKLMQDWLDNNDILVIAERFIKTLKAKTY